MGWRGHEGRLCARAKGGGEEGEGEAKDVFFANGRKNSRRRREGGRRAEWQSDFLALVPDAFTRRREGRAGRLNLVGFLVGVRGGRALVEVYRDDDDDDDDQRWW